MTQAPNLGAAAPLTAPKLLFICYMCQADSYTAWDCPSLNQLIVAGYIHKNTATNCYHLGSPENDLSKIQYMPKLNGDKLNYIRHYMQEAFRTNAAAMPVASISIQHMGLDASLADQYADSDKQEDKYYIIADDIHWKPLYLG